MNTKLKLILNIALLALLVSCSSNQKNNNGEGRFVAKVPYETLKILPLIDDVLDDLEALRFSGHSQAILCLKISRIQAMAKRMERRKNWPNISEVRHRQITSFCSGIGISQSSFGIKKLQVKSKLISMRMRINRYRKLSI